MEYFTDWLHGIFDDGLTKLFHRGSVLKMDCRFLNLNYTNLGERNFIELENEIYSFLIDLIYSRNIHTSNMLHVFYTSKSLNLEKTV
jgi:hypothetical protein